MVYIRAMQSEGSAGSKSGWTSEPVHERAGAQRWIIDYIQGSNAEYTIQVGKAPPAPSPLSQQFSANTWCASKSGIRHVREPQPQSLQRLHASSLQRLESYTQLCSCPVPAVARAFALPAAEPKCVAGGMHAWSLQLIPEHPRQLRRQPSDPGKPGLGHRAAALAVRLLVFSLDAASITLTVWAFLAFPVPPCLMLTAQAFDALASQPD